MAMTHKSRLSGIAIDCKATDLDAAGRFWGDPLGAAIKSDPAHPSYREIFVADGQPRMLLQAVDHDSRVHLDIETDDKEAEGRRLEALGAKRISTVKRWIVMEAPTGHRLCVVNPQRPDFEFNAKTREGT